MNKRLLTLEDLAKFCANNKLVTFSAKDSGYQLAVQVPAKLEFKKDESLDSKDLKFYNIKVCHTLLNRNQSYISEENMKKALPSLKYRPFLATIHQLDDGTWDFHSHDMEFDKDGQPIYIEQQIGNFTVDTPTLEYDEDQDKTYVNATVVISETYTKAVDIINRKGGTDVSCELAIENMEYNAEKNYLELVDFYFSGCTALGAEKDGTKVEPGMEGSGIVNEIADFSVENNGICVNAQNKLLETLDKLNATLSKFSIEKDSKKKGVEEEMDKLQALMEEYNVTEEDIDFEVEGLSDEDLEAAFEEHFKCKKKKKKYEDGETESEEDPEAEPESDPESEQGPTIEEPEDEEEDDPEEDHIGDDDEDKRKKKYSVDENGNISIAYELSHDDVRNGLYQLLCAENKDYNWIIKVFDDKLIYQDCSENKFYRRGYSKNGDNIALYENKTEVFNEWLSQAEKDAVSALKADYEALKDFKNQYDADTAKAEKETVFAGHEYDEIRDSDEFKTLVADMDKYSVEEIKVKADLLYAASMKKRFAVEQEVPEKHSVGMNFNSKGSKNKKAYAGLFDD